MVRCTERKRKKVIGRDNERMMQWPMTDRKFDSSYFKIDTIEFI